MDTSIGRIYPPALVFKKATYNLFAKATALVNLLIKFLLLLVLIAIFVPLSPKMPASSLDASWALGLNQAVVQGLSFGKDIIFTLGPYSFIYTKLYHPQLDPLMIGGSLYLALNYWLGLLWFMKNSRGSTILASCFFFFLMIYSRDALFFSYPLLIGLLALKTAHGEMSPHPSLGLSLLFAPFGLLCLIKGTLFILCLAVNGLCFLFFIFQHQKKQALMCLIIPWISTMCFWGAVGQPLSALPYYILTMLSLVSGFTEAMSVDGTISELILYLLNACLLLSFIIGQKQQAGSNKLFLAGLFFIFLFLSFKAGFTRHYGHALIPGTSILMASLALVFIFKSRRLLLISIVSFSSWHYINAHSTSLPFYNNFISNYSSAIHGLHTRIHHPESLKQNFNLSLAFLQQQLPLPKLRGSTDIYSYHQAHLLAAANQWKPRPVFQSYSVFNPYLAEKNKQHLQKTPPDYLFFKVEPIDERLPSLEDGASWPYLLSQYTPIEWHNGFLLLHHKKNTLMRLESSTWETYHLGERVNLPPTNQLILVKLIIKPTWFNRLVAVVFKPQHLKISVRLKNGMIQHYRLSSNMAQSSFLISPLIDTTNEFMSLYHKGSDLQEKQVHDFLITVDGKNTGQWRSQYALQWQFLAPPQA